MHIACIPLCKTCPERSTPLPMALVYSELSINIYFCIPSDLVPKENVEAWLKYLRSDYPTVAFKASTQSQKENLVGTLQKMYQ